MRHRLSTLFSVLPLLLSAQFDLHPDQSIPVTRNGQLLGMPWAGGLNYPQVSDIDLDADGDKDLFLFDRSGNQVITLINDGVEGQISYHLSHDYDHIYPFAQLQEWALLRDYNCDGKEDLFTYTNGGVAVYKNTSVGGHLSFEQVDTLVRTNYVPTVTNLYITQVDIPGIEDIDGDDDLDILTFSIFGNFVEFHRNMSMERYGTCDSLAYEVHNRCWGFFSESLTSNALRLNNPCQYNVPAPEFPGRITEWVQQLKSSNPAVAANALKELRAAHVGSTLLPLDLDGDRDMDLILGDVLYNNLVALTNGGTIAQANMTAQDTLFPQYDDPVNLDLFPAAFFKDINNDGKRDLIVTPNYPTQSQNFQSVWYYKNVGTDSTPVFNFQQEDVFQDRMLDFGEGAYPVAFDYDRDGLMDLVVADYGYYQQGGSYPSKMALLHNTGTASEPAFTLVTDHYADLDTTNLKAIYPAFGDMDGDGDMDLYLGEYEGLLHFYRNVAVSGPPQFSPQSNLVKDDNGTVIDVGQFSTPQFFDLDNDGLQDLLIGERNGNLSYYRNTGTTSSPVWHLENDSVGGVNTAEWWNVTGFSVPCMFRGPDGQARLLLGSESGWIHAYDSIDNNLNGTWRMLDSTWQDIHEGARTGLAVHDFDGNGSLDVVIGNYRGGISFWRNDHVTGIEQAAARVEHAFQVMPNPANTAADILLALDARTGMRLDVLNELGQTVRSLPVRGKRLHMDTEGLRNGVYMLRLSDGPARWTERLVVLHE
ncbi:MAG: FG-GAP-like repeat-containing protein [Flavobacteriales bacterium]